MGQPFSNPILGSQGALVRAQARSPNYVPGVSGWNIAKTGTVEFNQGTFRGGILLGSPPSQGAVSLGLTGTNVPATLRALSTDYTWFEVDVYWIDATQYFFSGLAFNSNVSFNRMERITGLYTTLHGVQLQTFVDATSAGNSYYLGSSVYDTVPLDFQWRATNLIVNSDCSMVVAVPTYSQVNGVTETWHGITFSNSWANLGGGRPSGYRFVTSPPTSVEITGQFSVPAGSRGDGTIIGTVSTSPVNYAPATQVDLPAVCNSLGAAGTNTPHFNISSTGNITCWGMSTATSAALQATYSTDR